MYFPQTKEVFVFIFDTLSNCSNTDDTVNLKLDTDRCPSNCEQGILLYACFLRQVLDSAIFSAIRIKIPIIKPMDQPFQQRPLTRFCYTARSFFSISHYRRSDPLSCCRFTTNYYTYRFAGDSAISHHQHYCVTE